ncbi:unnamed protein product [Schistosoma margrebowiei]|uniref:Suppressor protein SRP40-like n=1 Tax=Schistosoma margrebowiei TaxID=48269 RepID=A0AA84ZM28_9TREM|nr:unnamed protein product [Schistosoma margrebowiei]
MRLRSSIRRASKTFKCLQKDNDVKSKPYVTSGNVSGKIKHNICEPSSKIPKTLPLICKDVSRSRRINKGKQTPIIPEDPYLFIDNDSDDNKENIIPDSSKDVTRKHTKRTHSNVKVKVANPKQSKSKQWPASTAFTKQYIPSGKSNDARYEGALHANTPESIVTAVPLVSKTVNLMSAPTLPESNQLISPGSLTISCSVTKEASTYAESKTVPLNFHEKVCDSCQATSSVSNTPECRKCISIHNLEESIPRYSKTTLTSLNPQIASTPAISNANTELQTMGCHPLIPTPINYTAIKRNENSHDDSSQVLESHLPNNSSSSSNPHSGTTNNKSSSQDLSKESTSSSNRRRKQASESERQKAYDSWLADFNNELQKYESFELSVENQALSTDDH